MGLLGNNFRNSLGAGKALHTVPARVQGHRCGYHQICYSRSPEMSTEVYDGSANPIGAYPPTTFYPPQVSGEIAIRIFSSGTLTANLFPSKSMEIDMTGFGDLTAEAALVISMFCDMTGSGDLEATITGLLNMSIDMNGSGDLEATMSGFANMIIDLEGSGDLEATIAAYGNMSLDIVVTGTGLTIENVGNAVWQYLASQSTDPLTMGGKMNAAGNAGDPWSTILPGTYTGEQAGKIVADMEDLIRKIKALTSANL